jgi:hypothetical protein
MTMDAILQLPPTLPPHDSARLAPVPHEIVATWPTGTFIENLVVLPSGDVIVSVLSEARLDRVSRDGRVSILRQFEAPPTGLALAGGDLYVAVGEPGAHAPTLWRLDPGTGAGEPFMALADMIFANGVTNFAPAALLIADSWQGRLVRVDLSARAAVTWFQHEALTRAPGIDFLPGANGVKRWGEEVTVSSNGRAELYRIPVRSDGSAGEASLIADRLRVDDIAYDADGRLYLTTHIGHSLDRLGRDGTRVSLAGPDQGLAGSTACAFAPDGTLLVTTTGGIVTPPGGVLQPAKLVRLHVGAAGHPLDHAWEIRS